MPDENNETAGIRSYLLGSFEGDRDAFEERLMTDDKFFQDFLAIEEDLIQEYADEELEPADRERFEKNFLITSERLEKLRFARSLRKRIDRLETGSKSDQEPERKRKIFGVFSGFFANPVPVAVGLLLVIGVSVLLIWNFYLRSTASDLALASLNKAFRAERPLEARISGFEYAPKRPTRGNKSDRKIDRNELELAELEIRKNVSQNPSAENLHSLGRLYLAEKQFDEAIRELEKAGQLAPNDALIGNDLGVAYLEKFKLSDNKSAQVELSNTAVSRFDQALRIDPGLLSALFNKALILQYIPLPEDAKKTWQEYLKKDPDSQWAVEARKYLEEMNNNTMK